MVINKRIFNYSISTLSLNYIVNKRDVVNFSEVKLNFKDQMIDELLIEIFLFNPCTTIYTLITNKLIALRQLYKENNSLKKLYFLWLQGEMTISRVKLARMALKENNNTIFKRVFNKDITDVVILNIAECGKIKLLKDVIEYTSVNHNRITYYAAKGNHSNIIDYMISSGINCWNNIAQGAAEYGNFDLVMKMIEKGASNWNWIANSAARGGNKEIIEIMINKGATSYNWIACGAASGGYIDIIKSLQRYGIYKWDDIAKSAVEYGNIEILNYMISLGATNWNKIAWNAAFGGHLHMVLDMIRRGATNINKIAAAAAKGGHIDIVYELIGLSNNPINYNWIAHGAIISCDEKLFFKMVRMGAND